MDNAPKNEETKEQATEEATPVGDGGKQTILEPGQRETGQDSNQNTRPGAEAEAPGAKNNQVPGSPNQGTEVR
jgi:photosystem I subunit 4